MIASAISQPAYADAANFPPFDDIHAHTEVLYTVPMKVERVYKVISRAIQMNKDPAVIPGTYKFYDNKTNDFIWA